MATRTHNIPSNAFSSTEAQDIFDEAQLYTEKRFSHIPYLRDQLRVLYQESLEDCNRRDIHPMTKLGKAMSTERAYLDAYNKHRLGNSITPFNPWVLDPANTIEYKEEENIPEMVEWFPLRAALARRGVVMLAPPIYQVRGTVEGVQQRTRNTNNLPKAPVQARNTRQKTTPSQSGTQKKKQTGLGSAKYNKLRDAPSPWLAFPSGNLTMAEILAFIPHSIKSFDVIDRFLYNGAYSTTLAEMINYYRTMPNGPIENNSIYRMMKIPMDTRAKTDKAYENWKVTAHQDIKKPAGFDPTNINVTNFRTPGMKNPREVAAAAKLPPPSILFRDMVNGVKIMPSGYDALDLTRCIKHCMENEDEDWYYPQDFAELVNHLGGPAPVYREHQDKAAIARLTSADRLRNAKVTGARERDRCGRLLKHGSSSPEAEEEEGDAASYGSNGDVDHTDNTAKQPTVSSKKGPKRRRSPDHDHDEEDEDEDVAVKAPSKRRKTSNTRPVTRSSKRKAETPREESFTQDTDDDEDDLYAEPKSRKKPRVTIRSPPRNHGFSGGHSVDHAIVIGDNDKDLYESEEEDAGEDEHEVVEEENGNEDDGSQDQSEEDEEEEEDWDN